MKPVKTLIILSILAGLFAIIQSGMGLFWQDNGSPFSFTTLHGDIIQMAGQGIYRNDTFFKAPINRGADAVTLFVVVPLLAIALLLTKRGSLRGRILLTGILSFLVYNSASVALGVAYNDLFLVYTAYFSASLFAFILAFTAVDRKEIAAELSTRAPRKGISALMFASALGLLAAWLPDVIGALLQRTVPAITSYTTEVTYVFDLGIIVPLSILAGFQTLRRTSPDYLLSVTLLIMLVFIGIMVTSQSIFQYLAGIELPIQVFAAKAASFMTLALIAAGLLFRFFRGLGQPGSMRKPLPQANRA